jgi:hypothetical protein
MTLPTFIMIGAPKAGTTSYFHYLDEHPEIYMFPEKHTNFFCYDDALNWRWTDEGKRPSMDEFHAKSIEEYEAGFAGATDEIAIGEVSEKYIRCPTAPQRIRECIPDVKLVASLRNPVDRAFSNYLMWARFGKNMKSLDEELSPETNPIKGGRYFHRMKRYYDLFPRDQIKVYIFDELKTDPVKVMQDLYAYLGVDPTFTPNTAVRHNRAAVPKVRIVSRIFHHRGLTRAAKTLLPTGVVRLAKKVREKNMTAPPELPDDLRARLLDYYREDILKLEELLNRDLSIWLTES